MIDIDKLISIEGNEPALGYRYSLNQLLSGGLSNLAQRQIDKDINTITYWRDVFAEYVGQEEKLLEREVTLINIWDPPICGHLIHDGFHRLAAAKLAGLRVIGAWLAPLFDSH